MRPVRLHPLVSELKEIARTSGRQTWGQIDARNHDLRLWPLGVSRQSLSRALRIMQGLVAEAERRGYEVRPTGAASQGGIRDVCIVVYGHEYPVTAREKRGLLQVTLPGAYSGRREWNDGSRGAIEGKLGGVLAEIEAKADQAEERRITR